MQFASSLGTASSFGNHSNFTESAAGALGNDMSARPAANANLSPSEQCIFPSYFSHFAVLILIAISVVTQLTHITKVLLMIVVTG